MKLVIFVSVILLPMITFALMPARAADKTPAPPPPELQQIATDWQGMMTLQGHVQTDLQALIRHVQEQDAEIARLRAAAPKPETPLSPAPPKVKSPSH